MKQKADNNTDRFARMGMAAMMPGMVYMIELMQEQLDQLRAMIGMVQPEPQAPIRVTNKLLERHDDGTLTYKKRRAKGAGSYWDKLSPEERSAEMQRRMAKRQASAAPDGYVTTSRAQEILGVNNTNMVRLLASRANMKMKHGPGPAGKRPVYLLEVDVQKLAAKRVGTIYDSAK